MNQEQSQETAKHTYTMCILFGMWLKEPAQRKRLSKVDASQLFDEWINKVLEEVQNAKD